MRQNHVDSKRTRMLRARAFLTFEFVSLLASCRSVRRHTQVPAAKTCFIIIRTSKFGQLARAAEFSAARQRLSSVATSTRTTRGIIHPEPWLGFTPGISVQLRSNSRASEMAFPCKRHQKQHLEFCTAYLRTRRPGVRVPPGAPLFPRIRERWLKKRSPPVVVFSRRV